MFKRREGTASAAFAEQWHARCGAAMQAAAAASPQVLRYSQSHALGQDSPIANAPASPFDGVDELWCETLEGATAFFAAEAFAGSVVPLEAEVVDAGASAVIVGEVRTMWQRAAEPQADAVKLMILPVRKAGTSVAEFRHHWMEVHSPLALDGPGARQRLQRVEFCPGSQLSLGGLPAAVCEGSGSIWFDSARDLEAEFGSDYYRSTLQPDEQRFADGERSRGLILRERRVWDRTSS